VGHPEDEVTPTPGITRDPKPESTPSRPPEDFSGIVGSEVLFPQKPDLVLPPYTTAGGKAAHDDKFQLAAAAIKFHLDARNGGVNWNDAVTPMTEKFLEMVSGSSFLIGLLQEDVNALWAMTDPEIADKIANGEQLSQFGDVFDAMGDIMWTVGETELAVQAALDSSKAVKTTFEALTFEDVGDDARLAAGQLEGTPGRREAFTIRTLEEGVESGASFGNLLDNPGAWVYDSTGNILVVTLDMEGGERTVGVKPRAGFDPTDHLDVIIEVLLAVQSEDPERFVGGFDDSSGLMALLFKPLVALGEYANANPKFQDSLDDIRNTFVKGVTSLIPVPGVSIELDSLEQADNRIQEEGLAALEEATKRNPVFREELFVARLAPALIAEAAKQDLELGSQDALLIAAGIVTENKDALKADFEKLTAKQLKEEIEAEFEDKTAVGQIIDETLERTLDVMEMWTAVTQVIAVNVIQVAELIPQGTEALVAGDTEEAFELVKEAFTVETGTTVGDYFELEGTFYDTANVISSMFFDPVNLFLPGAAGAAKTFFRAMTNPASFRLYLRGRHMQALTKVIAEDTGIAAIKNVWYLNNIDNVGYNKLMDLAESSTATIKDVEKVLTEQAGKWWLGNGPHRPITSNTIEGMEKLTDLLAKGPASEETLEKVVAMVSQLAANRSINVGESQGLSEFANVLHQLERNPDDFVKWMRIANDATKYEGDAVQGALTATKARAQQAVSRATVQRGELVQDVEGIQRNLFQINDSLSKVDSLGLDAADEGLPGLLNRLGVDPNEELVFHGTDLESAASISEGGLEAGGLAQTPELALRLAEGKTDVVLIFRSKDLPPELKGTVEQFFTADEAARLREFPGSFDDLPSGATPLIVDKAPKPIAKVNAEELRAALGAGEVSGGTPKADLVKRRLRAQRTLLERNEVAAAPTVAEIDTTRKFAHTQLVKAGRLEGDMVINPHEGAIADVMHKYYDDLAKKINKEKGKEVIPIEEGKVNPFSPGTPVRDWTVVTGSRRLSVPTSIDELRMVEGLGVDNADLVAGLDAVGIFRRNQRVTLPVSPYEIQLYRRVSGNEAVWAKVVNQMRVNMFSSTIRWMKLGFGINLLWNPMTAGRITFDETFRFLAQTGDFPAFFKASVAGLPGAALARRKLVGGAAAEVEKVAGAADLVGLGDKVRSIPGFKKVTADSFTEWVSNPNALQYGRGAGGFVGDEVYQWVTPGQAGFTKQEYVLAAERWINGTVARDPLFEHYSRFVPNATKRADGTLEMPPEFRTWWEEGLDGGVPGYTYARQAEFVIGGEKRLVETSAVYVWETIDSSLNLWVDNLISPVAAQRFKRRFIEAASKRGEPFATTGDDAYLLGSIERIPAAAEGGRTGGLTQMVGRGFTAMMGNPSARRGSVFFEHFFDQAKKIYMARFEGRVMTWENIVAEGQRVGRQVSEGEAKSMLAEGANNSVVRAVMERTGGVTEAQIDVHSATYATVRANDLMYRFEATSLVGRGVESGLAFPFARAQVDFLAWWTKHLTTPLRLREGLAKWFPQADQALQEIPLNFRALTKYAHMMTAVNNDEPSLFDQAIDNLTFFPTNFSTEFLIDILPQPAVPGWIVDQLHAAGKLPDSVVETLEDVFPTMGFQDETVGLLDRVFTPGGRSLLANSWGTMQWLGGMFGWNPEDWEDGYPGMLKTFLSDGKLPPAQADFAGAGLAVWLDEFAFDFVPGTLDAQNKMTEIGVEAGFDAIEADRNQQMRKALTPFDAADREFRILVSYAPLFEGDLWNFLDANGVLSTSDKFEVDGLVEIKTIYEKFQEGEATEKDKLFLREALRRIYQASGRKFIGVPEAGFTMQDFLNISAPGLTANLVAKSLCSGVRVTPGSDHEAFHTSHCNSQTQRLQEIPDGSTGGDLLRDARNRGWVTTRRVDGDVGYGQDAHEAVFKSARDAVGAAWWFVTGRTWAQGSKGSVDRRDYVIPAFVSEILELTKLELEAGTTMTGEEFHNILFDHRKTLSIPRGPERLLITEGPIVAELSRTSTGRKLIQDVELIFDSLDERGISTFDDWPETNKKFVRDWARILVVNQDLNQGDYDRWWKPLFGAIDYDELELPTLDDVKKGEGTGLQITPEQVTDGSFEVVDGDTVSILMADGPMRVRLIGINAPEQTDVGWSEATQNLLDLIQGADDIAIVFYKIETFGLSQTTRPDEIRLKGFLYVNGIPIYDPALFTASNPTGAGTGGEVLDLQSILEGGTP